MFMRPWIRHYYLKKLIKKMSRSEGIGLASEPKGGTEPEGIGIVGDPINGWREDYETENCQEGFEALEDGVCL